MRLNSTGLGLLAVGGFVAMLPFSGGCANGGGNFSDHTSALRQDANARVAYVATRPSEDGTRSGITGDVSYTGTESADIKADGTVASYMPDEKDGTDQQDNLARDHAADPAELYGDTKSSIVVERHPEVNEQQDAFLTYHEQEVNGFTEYTRGYVGTRSDASVVADLRGRTDHSATYTGKGSADVGQGEFNYFIDGDLNLKAQFAGRSPGISGQITQTAPTDPQTNPNGVNQITFDGSFVDNTPDYTIQNIKLKNPTSDIATIDNGGGVGSFFGSHAQGTMGTFAGSGQTNDADPSPVNVIGSFVGTTTDN